MMDITKADALAAARGLTDWALDSGRQAALVNASDFLKRYPVRSTLSSDEQDRLDLATFLLAVEFLDKGTPALAASTTVKKQESQLGDLRTATEYFEGGSDPYPQVTALMASLAPRGGSAGFYSGIQRL